MAESFKDKVEDAGHKIAETATKVGHKVGEKVEEAADWAKEKAHQAGHRIEEAAQKVEHKTGAPLAESTGPVGSTADIREHMEVYASCGTKVGKVDHVEGDHDQADQERQPRRPAPPDPAGVGGQGPRPHPPEQGPQGGPEPVAAGLTGWQVSSRSERAGGDPPALLGVGQLLAHGPASA